MEREPSQKIRTITVEELEEEAPRRVPIRSHENGGGKNLTMALAIIGALVGLGGGGLGIAHRFEGDDTAKVPPWVGQRLDVLETKVHAIDKASDINATKLDEILRRLDKIDGRLDHLEERRGR